MQEQFLNHSSSFESSGFFEIKPTAELKTSFNVKPLQVEEVLENPRRAQPHANEAAVMITNAELLIKFEENDLAEHLLRQCLYLNPKHPQALKKLAEVCSGSDIRLKAYETLLQSEYSFKNLANLAHCYYKDGNAEKARETYEMALSAVTEEDSELFEVYKNLGNIFMRENDFEAAEEFYNKAFTLDEKSAVLQVNLGTLAMQRADTEMALNRFRGALELDAKNDKAWVGLGMVHNDMGDFVLARANIENAIDINPMNRTAVQLASTWAVRDHDLGFAVEALKNYVSGYIGELDFKNESHFCDEEMSLLLIHLFCLKNQFVEAKLEVERLLLWNPSSPKLQAIEEEIRNASLFKR